MDEKLKPFYCRKTEVGYGASCETSSNALGSDFDFNKLAATFRCSEIFCNESSLNFGLKTAYGFNLPFSQLFNTNRRDGMLGNYALEYRGTELALTNLSYHYLFFKNRKGHLNGEVFTEFAETWNDNTGKSKEGIGFNISYSFWRFPIPIGLGYTYSFDDNDWQTSFSIGGVF
jgi:outer membrane protein assembly factor BamA